MGLSNAVSGFGTLYKLGDGAAVENFTTVAEVHGVSGVGSTYNLHETTHEQSTNAYREWLPGLLDNDAFTIGAAYVPSEATQGSSGLRGQHRNRTRVNHRIVIPTVPQSQIDYASLVPKYHVDLPLDGVAMLNFEVKPTGPLTYS